MTTSRNSAEIYLAANISLRRAMRRNIRDRNLCNNLKERIVYFVDTNIVEWYLDRSQTFALISDLMPAMSRSEVRRIEFVTSFITSEYIFSKNLPGSESNPLFMTPFHAEELTERIEILLRKIKSSAILEIKPDIIARLQKELNIRIKKFEYQKTSYNLSSMFNYFEKFISSQYGDMTFRLDRARTLFDDRKIVKAQEMRDFNLDRRLYLAETNVNYWKERLLYHGKPEDLSKSLDKDARSLVLLQTLNAMAVNQNRRLRYVLITSDEKIHSAVDSWRIEQQFTAIDHYDFLRHPKQYIPLLNTSDTKQEYSGNKATFKELFNGVDNLVGAERDASTFRDGAPSNRIYSYFTNKVLPNITEQLNNPTIRDQIESRQQIKSNWKHAIESASILNYDMVNVVFQKIDDLSSRYYSELDNDMERLLEDRINKDVHKISLSHMKFSARGQLASLLLAFRTRNLGDDEKVSFVPRSLPLVLVDTPISLLTWADQNNLSRNKDLCNFIESIFKLNNTELIDNFEATCETLGSESLAYVSCISAFLLGDWSQSRYLCERIVNISGRRESQRLEFEFLKIVSSRFEPLDILKLQSNRQLLQRHKREARTYGSPFHLARVYSEAAAQNLFYAFSATLLKSRENFGSDVYATQCALDAIKNLAGAYKIVLKDQSFKEFFRKNEKKARSLKITVLANIISSRFFIELGPMRKAVKSGDTLFFNTKSDDICSELLEEIDLFGSYLILPEFYALCGLVKWGDPALKSETLDRLNNCITRIEENFRALEILDQHEIEWIRDELSL